MKRLQFPAMRVHVLEHKATGDVGKISGSTAVLVLPDSRHLRQLYWNKVVLCGLTTPACRAQQASQGCWYLDVCVKGKLGVLLLVMTTSMAEYQ